jgi:hypothetical protein
MPVKIEDATVSRSRRLVSVEHEKSTTLATIGRVLPGESRDVHVPVRMVMAEMRQHRSELDGVTQAMTKLYQEVLQGGPLP